MYFNLEEVIFVSGLRRSSTTTTRAWSHDPKVMNDQISVVPVVKHFTTRLTAEVPADFVYLFGERFLTHLSAVVASDTL